MTIRKRPGPVPSPGPLRTVRLALQVRPDEYDKVLADAHAAGFSHYSDYLRFRLGLDPILPKNVTKE